ncbi:SRPBCC family protein [Mycolicibacterium boenickei]|nr:SRPBCC family protein [Mycolicibacterium boenickei]
MIGTQTASIRIAKPRDELWELLVTIAAIPDWYDDWDTVEYDDQTYRRLQSGVGFRLVRHHDRGIEVAQCRVVLAEAPRRLRWIEDGPHVRAISVDFHLEPESAEATMLTLTKSC